MTIIRTLQELSDKAKEIVHQHFEEVVNVSTTVLINSYNPGLHIGIGYFVKENGKNVFGNISAKGFDEAIQKLNAYCILHKVQEIKDSDIIFETIC